MAIRLPAEWEEQDGIQIAWPHGESDWLPHLHVVEPVYLELVKQITRFERVVITSPHPNRVRDILFANDVNLEQVLFFAVDGNDTWARDFGPISVTVDGNPLLLDFTFNGWGLKFAADLDNLITRRLHRAGLFTPPIRTIGMVLEGGSIESDGKGTILTTAACLLSPNRNPHLDRLEIEQELRNHLGARHFLWLEAGHLEGDDTDAHIDTLARFCPDDTIAHVTCDNESDIHYQAIADMVAKLKGFVTAEGRPYRLVPLPFPGPRYDETGCRLPATYANFLVINGAVLVPTYNDPADRAALDAVASAFPGREIIGIDSLPLILQHGSLHCVTMQLPRGTIRRKCKGELP